MIQYEEKEVKRIEKVKVGVICDGCKKQIDPKSGYFHVRTGHNDWGNDSVESLEQYDFCCPECVFALAVPYINESHTGRFNTKGIEIEHIKGYLR